MFEIVTGKDTHSRIESICADDGPIYFAVAYWGLSAATRALDLAGDRLHVVLDVNAGGTNPLALGALIKALGNRVRVHPDLHAKIYASKTSALVGSANVSDSGWQLELSARHEAGFFVDGKAASDAYDHAKDVFERARFATEADVETCRQRFGKRTVKESLLTYQRHNTFMDSLLDPEGPLAHLPLILTDQYIPEEENAAAWADPENPHKASHGVEFNTDLLDRYDFVLAPEYMQTPCVALHIAKKKIWASLVLPFQGRPTAEETFSMFLDWTEVLGPNTKFKRTVER